jgi:hypothetical protein
MIHYHTATNTLTAYNLGTDSLGYNTSGALFYEEYTAFDPESRFIYAIDPEGSVKDSTKLYKYIIDKHEVRLIDWGPDVPDSAMWNRVMPLWDSTNKIILWPLVKDEVGSYQPPVQLHAYHPSTGTWEGLSASDPIDRNGLPILVGGVPVEIIGRVAVYDPRQNVIMVTGSDAANAVPYIFLYRYGNGAGTAAWSEGGGGESCGSPGGL